MLKQTVTYPDINGNDITEDLYFNMSKAELTLLETEIPGGYASYLQALGASQDAHSIAQAVDKILLASYGVRRGNKFVKSKDITDEFRGSEAYSQIFMKIVQDEKFAIEFVNGILPNDIREQAKKIEAEEKAKEDKKSE